MNATRSTPALNLIPTPRPSETRQGGVLAAGSASGLVAGALTGSPFDLLRRHGRLVLHHQRCWEVVLAAVLPAGNPRYRHRLERLLHATDLLGRHQVDLAFMLEFGHRRVS